MRIASYSFLYILYLAHTTPELSNMVVTRYVWLFKLLLMKMKWDGPRVCQTE